LAIYDNLTEFAGLPVVAFGGDVPDDLPDDMRAAYEDAYRTARPDPGAFAWRLHASFFPYGDFTSFAHVFARFVDEVDTEKVTALIIGRWMWGEDDLEVTAQEPVGVLVEHADRFPALRALFLGELVQEEAEISWIQQCDVTPLLAAFPRLEELRVRGGNGLEFPATRHEALRTLAVETGGLPGEVTTGILASDLPALEHLELWFGSGYYGCTTELDDLAPLFEGELFPNLRSLGLRNDERTDDLVGMLAGAPLLDRLDVLDLSLGTLSDAGADLIARAPAFRRLRRLDLHHHYLTEEGEARLRAALPGVDLDLSERGEPRVHDGEVHYYAAVTE